MIKKTGGCQVPGLMPVWRSFLIVCLVLSGAFINAGAGIADNDKQSTEPPHHIVVRKHAAGGGLWDIYIFYDGIAQPIAASKGKQMILTQKVAKEDTAKIMAILAAHEVTMVGLESRIKGNYQEAEKHYKIALEGLGDDNPVLPECLMNLAGLYLKTDRSFEAEKLYRRIIALYDKDPPVDAFERAIVCDNLSQALTNENEFAEAEKFNKMAMDIFRGASPPAYSDLSKCYTSLGGIKLKENHVLEAEGAMKEALKAAEFTDDPKLIAVMSDNLASCYNNEGKYKDALDARKKALKLFEDSYGPEHPETAVCLVNTAHTLISLWEWKEAEGYLQRAIKIIEKQEGTASPTLRQLKLEYDLCVKRAAK